MTLHPQPPEQDELREQVDRIITNRAPLVQGHDEQLKALLALFAAQAAATQERAEKAHEKECLALIDERDSLENRLDSLAQAVASYFGKDVGEHSSMNDPWYNAFELLRDNTPAAQPKQQRSEGSDE
jgi:hypothetical protein